MNKTDYHKLFREFNDDQAKMSTPYDYFVVIPVSVAIKAYELEGIEFLRKYYPRVYVSLPLSYRA